MRTAAIRGGVLRASEYRCNGFDAFVYHSRCSQIPMASTSCHQRKASDNSRLMQGFQSRICLKIGRIIARPMRLKVHCVPHCSAPLNFEASPENNLPRDRNPSICLDHFAILASSGLKEAPCKSSLISIPRTVKGLPVSSFLAEIDVAPNRHRTSL